MATIRMLFEQPVGPLYTTLVTLHTIAEMVPVHLTAP